MLYMSSGQHGSIVDIQEITRVSSSLALCASHDHTLLNEQQGASLSSIQSFGFVLTLYDTVFHLYRRNGDLLWTLSQVSPVQLPSILSPRVCWFPRDS